MTSKNDSLDAFDIEPSHSTTFVCKVQSLNGNNMSQSLIQIKDIVNNFQIFSSNHF